MFDIAIINITIVRHCLTLMSPLLLHFRGRGFWQAQIHRSIAPPPPVPLLLISVQNDDVRLRHQYYRTTFHRQDRASWQTACDGFAVAWRHGRGLVDRWECQEIPAHYARVSERCNTTQSKATRGLVNSFLSLMEKQKHACFASSAAWV